MQEHVSFISLYNYILLTHVYLKGHIRREGLESKIPGSIPSNDSNPNFHFLNHACILAADQLQQFGFITSFSPISRLFMSSLFLYLQCP